LGEDALRVVAADSGAAVLDDYFKPLLVVAATAVLVDPPYRRARFCLAEPIFSKVEEGPLLVIHELELCRIQLSRMRISGRARRQVLKILPKIRKIASDIRRVHDIEVLALGKNSIPVRIAELTSGAYAVLYSAERAVKEAFSEMLNPRARGFRVLEINPTV